MKLYLPRSAGDSAGVGEIGSPATAAQSRSETILVVEDNELLLASVRTLLREQGYRVLIASNASTALEVLASGNTDLLFTDVRLPGRLDRRQLADEGRRLCPDLKVLFTTGYTRNAIIHQGRLDPGVEMIGKPFTYAALIVKVQRVLSPAV